ncbi:MAG: signal peptidase II [bacterium]|nr:signal peptidase II [bacterium]
MNLLTKNLAKRTAFRLALAVAAVVLLIDQLSKNWARDTYGDSAPGEIIGTWLRFTYRKNPGAAFSSFTGSGQLIGLVAIGVALFLVYLIGNASRRAELLALGLILGGALGNLCDRVFRGEGFLDGAVVDWIDWWFIPTFNIADASLNIGVAVLLFAALFGAGARE